jgi:predicted nucleotidyltransferase
MVHHSVSGVKGMTPYHTHPLMFPGKRGIIKCMKIDAILSDLVTSLKASNPSKIILFGSYAAGTENEDSDIDLMVILDNDDVSRTYQQRMAKKLFVRKLVREINYKVALDILVYSKAELKIIKENGNYFIDEVEKTGKVLYEKAG